MDEQWSSVGKKSEPRWLCTALIMPPVRYWPIFGRRKDDVFKQLKALLEPFNITRYYRAYERHLDAANHQVGKQNTQKIERKNLNLRTWIKRLTSPPAVFPSQF